MRISPEFSLSSTHCLHGSNSIKSALFAFHFSKYKPGNAFTVSRVDGEFFYCLIFINIKCKYSIFLQYEISNGAFMDLKLIYCINI